MTFFNLNNISFSNQLLNLPLKLNYFFGNIAFISLFFAVLLYWFDFFNSRQISKKLKNICMIGANVSLAFLLLVRWYESGHFPLSNLYESLIGLAWGFTSVHLILVLNPIELLTQIAKKNLTANKIKIEPFHTELKTPKTKAYQKPIIITNNTSCLQSTDASPAFLFSPELNFYSTKSLAFMAEDQLSMQNNISKEDKEEKIEPFSNQLVPIANDKIGAITAPTALLTSVFATFFLPPEITRASALIPALKSNWLTMHVTVMVASYAFLLIGSLLSITYCVYRLVSSFSNKKNKEYSLQSNKMIITPPTFAGLNESDIHANHSEVKAKHSEAGKSTKASIEPTFFLNVNQHLIKSLKDKIKLFFFNAKNPLNSFLNKKTVERKNKSKKQNFFVLTSSTDIENFNFATWLNTTSYRILGLGFPLLTIGILSGAVWANEAWGSYWSWDPKETWALITWLVFAVYFHSRYTRSSDSFVPAIIASVGFLVIWICYLGVNLLGTGLHSYGWFSS